MPAGSTCSANGEHSTPSSRARSCAPGARPGSACACTPTSSGWVPGCSWRSRWARRRPTTALFCPPATSRRWPGRPRWPRCCRQRTSRPASPIPTPAALLDAGATVALATNCNPGSSYTTSMSFCIALAVREMGMTAEEALRAATLGGARPARDDIGALAPGCRADAIALDAASPTAPRLPTRRPTGPRNVRRRRARLGPVELVLAQWSRSRMPLGAIPRQPRNFRESPQPATGRG